MIELIRRFLGKRSALMGEILLILLIKGIFLGMLWWFFFSHPMDEALQPNDVSTHLMGDNVKK